MVAVCVTSVPDGAGKTMLCAGLGKQLQKDGRKVGYFKPVLCGDNASPATADSDAVFLKHALAMTEDMAAISPVFDKGDSFKEKIKQAYARVAQNKDVVLIEAPSYEASAEITAALDARVLLVGEYPVGMVTDTVKKLGQNLLGMIVNKVPANREAAVSGELSASLANAGAGLLGVITEDRTLAAISVADIAQKLSGNVINKDDGMDELVENIMLGAMTVDSGLDYFGRKDNKAVLVRGERPDMQLASLQTSTRCMVISGGAEPLPAVRLQSESKKVPIITVKGNTADTIAALEEIFTAAKFHQEKKLSRLTEIIGKQLNLKALYGALGLAK